MREGGQRERHVHGSSTKSESTKVAVRYWKSEGWLVVVGSGRERSFTTCQSQEAAEDLAATLATQIGAGALEEPETSPITVDDLMDRLLTAKKEQAGLRRSTVTWLGHAVKPVKKHLGAVSVRRLTRPLVEDYVRSRSAHQAAPRTIQGELKVLRMGLRFAATKGWQCATSDVASLRGLVFEETAEKQWLRAEEVQRFREAITNPAFALGCELALQAGLRVGEVITRKWKDLDERNNLLVIGPRPEADWVPKNGKTRLVPISKDLRLRLKRWRLAQGKPKADAWLIPTYKGCRRLDYHRWNNMVAVACEKAGVTPITFHGLRHTFASLALEAGIPLATVSKILGHHSVEFTAQQYIHFADRELVAVADRLQNYLTRPASRPASRKAKTIR